MSDSYYIQPEAQPAGRPTIPATETDVVASLRSLSRLSSRREDLSSSKTGQDGQVLGFVLSVPLSFLPTIATIATGAVKMLDRLLTAFWSAVALGLATWASAQAYTYTPFIQ